MRMPIRRFAVNLEKPDLNEALLQAAPLLMMPGEFMEFQHIELRPERVYRFWFLVCVELRDEE